MYIKKGDKVRITEFCLTPNLRGLVGQVMRKPQNNHFIVKFPRDSQLYILADNEVEVITEDHSFPPAAIIRLKDGQ